MDEIGRAILEHIVKEIAPGAGREAVAASRNLIADGYLDSLGLVSLLTFLRQALDVDVDEDDLKPETFATIDTIAALAKEPSGA